VTILTARTGGDLIGCVAVTRKDAKANAALAYLGMLCVLPTLQSAGLGRKLLDAAEDLARAHGIAVMEMTVIEGRDALIGWYERRGYAFTEERRPFPVLRDPPITSPWVSWFSTLLARSWRFYVKTARACFVLMLHVAKLGVQLAWARQAVFWLNVPRTTPTFLLHLQPQQKASFCRNPAQS
jgi:hypothetical protein